MARTEMWEHISLDDTTPSASKKEGVFYPVAFGSFHTSTNADVMNE